MLTKLVQTLNSCICYFTCTLGDIRFKSASAGDLQSLKNQVPRLVVEEIEERYDAVWVLKVYECISDIDTIHQVHGKINKVERTVRESSVQNTHKEGLGECLWNVTYHDCCSLVSPLLYIPQKYGEFI